MMSQVVLFIASFSIYSIIGLYVSVVLVIGQFIKGYIKSLPSDLLIDEIHNPTPSSLCDDIFTVREARKFVLEEILVGKLFYIIFRSPEKLIALTQDTKIKLNSALFYSSCYFPIT